MKTWVLGLLMLFWMTISLSHEATQEINPFSSGKSHHTDNQWRASNNSTGQNRAFDVQGRGKKDDKIMHSMYMGMMMVKAFFSIIFMFVNGIFQLKSFGFSLLNAIINIGRFLMQYNQHHHEQKVVKLPTDWASSGYGYGSSAYGNSAYGNTAYGSNQNFQLYPSAYSHQEQYQPEIAPADKVYRVQSNQEGNLVANSMAYSAYAGKSAATRT
ncbi:uncharacterized protein LOC111052176 [Nilaparvata lugens]|uniref:uncharacterized protein LOC111052176 n=1 Tax=Nilaparvata lugens TaxID=108931 RepID=UPI00193E66A5|nr:uncharacterized protein LOC111052176 [Nilaparvata lugens]XP_039298839.1 uncharacterized protein LOC111052176 [Nilaparvata lugens]